MKVNKLFMSMDVVQLVGWAAAVVGVLSFQARRRQVLIALQLGCCVLWMAHFQLMAAPAGALCNALALARGLVALRAGRSAAWRWAVLAFLPLVWGLALADAAGPLDWLPPLAMTFSTLALACRGLLPMRLLLLGSGPCWLAYEATIGSQGGVANELLNMTSLLIGLWRHHRRPAATGGPDTSSAPSLSRNPVGFPTCVV